MTVTSIHALSEGHRKREARQDKAVQVKFTEDELDDLDRLVAWIGDTSKTPASRASVIRALVLDGIVAFNEEIGDG